MAKKEFIVYAKYRSICSLNVEADTKEEAEEIARNTDGGHFASEDEDFSSDWHIVNSMTEEVGEIRKGCISYGEILELQSLKDHIEEWNIQYFTIQKYKLCLKSIQKNKQNILLKVLLNNLMK